jgi:hypothetical protein
MQLLNPYMLLTLGVIPLLIIIHTLKPKPRQVDVTNLFLWDAAFKERNRSLTFERLQKNLPLLLQLIIVVTVAVALARPTWTFLTVQKGNMIIVIDSSASMKTRSGTGIRFDRAREEALRLIREREPDQKVLIVEAGSKSAVKSGFLEKSGQAQELVKQIQPSDAPANLESAVYLALSFVDPLKDDLLYLITDGAGQDISALVNGHPKIRPVIIPGGQRNVGITKFEFRQQVGHIDQYEFMLEIMNFNASPVESPLRLSIDNYALLEQVITFDANEKKLLFLPYSGLISGVARATLQIDDDFTVDNEAFLSLSAAKEIWILLVSRGNHFLEKLLAAYPNFRVNAVKEIIPSSWAEQTARHDIVIVDRMEFPPTERGNFLLIDSYSPSIPLSKTGRVGLPEIQTWNHNSPLMVNVDLRNLIIEESARLHSDKKLQPVVESARTGLMYAFEEKGLRVVHFGFDFTKSDLPFKVAFPVMISNIFNWLNPHKLAFSILQTRAGETFDIHLSPQTDAIYIRAPFEKWEKHPVDMNPLKYNNTGRVGIYTIIENGKERYFTVNLTDASESDINSTTIENPPRKSESSALSEQISAQQPLWMIFVIMASLLLVIEWYSWLKS